MITPSRPDGREQGSALIIAVLVSVILSLLGISYLLMAKTENTIAENERNAAVALYVAEAGARLAVNWFNDPSSTGYLVPTSGQVDRTLRLLDHDNDSSTARVLASAGDASKPLYKDASLTASAVFDRPYRAALADTFLGIETGTDADPNNASRGPDLAVSQSHLDTINNTLFPNFPSPSLRARITRIEVYSPPILTLSGQVTRMGVATIKVTGGVFLFPGTAEERQIATRVVKAVVNEIPVPGPVGPLQSCSTLNYTGDFVVHWGTASSLAGAAIPSGANFSVKVNSGLPFALNDPYSYYSDPSAVPARNLNQWGIDHDGRALEDPWYKFIAGGAIASAPNSNPQPWPYDATRWSDMTYIGDDHSNIFQNTVINCPTFDYALWKSIAQSGNKNHFYFSYDSVSGNFKQDGTGSAVTLQNATTGRSGLFFFDTTDGLAPNASSTNLTPAISVASSSGWTGMVGFVYLNATQFETTGSGAIGQVRWIVPPGEPSDGTGFVNLDYPSGASADLTDTPTVSQTTVRAKRVLNTTENKYYCTDYSDCDAGTGAGIRADKYGVPFQDTVVLDGVLYISGAFHVSGNANYFGSLVARNGVIDGVGTPGFWFDERLIKGDWPPKGLNLPRVVVSSWQTDL